MEDYVWIRLRFDDVGLFTADLMLNNDATENLGGSYPRFVATRFDAWCKWGRKLPVHGAGFSVKDADIAYDEAEEL